MRLARKEKPGANSPYGCAYPHPMRDMPACFLQRGGRRDGHNYHRYAGDSDPHGGTESTFLRAFGASFWESPESRGAGPLSGAGADPDSDSDSDSARVALSDLETGSVRDRARHSPDLYPQPDPERPPGQPHHHEFGGHDARRCQREP